MKFLMINCADPEVDGAHGPFYVISDEDGQRSLLFYGDHEDEAYSKIIERAGINVEEYDLKDFMDALIVGQFAGELEGSEPVRRCPDCALQHSADCPLRVWGRTEKNEGKCLGTKPTDYCSHFTREEG